MNNSMYSNNLSQAVGFSGLRSYVGNVERALSRCRAANGASDQALVDDLSVDDNLPEPLLVTADSKYSGLSFSGVGDVIEQPYQLDSYSDKPKSSLVPALSSLAAIVVTGVLTVGLMLYLEQNKEPVASGSLLQLVEEAPPIGRGLVLNPSQIRYCIAQGIRLGGATEKSGTLSATSQGTLQSMLSDYDNRCAEYRFQAGAFDAARRDVESLRAQLQHEGMAMLASLEQSSVQKTLSEQVEVPAIAAVRDVDKAQLQIVDGEAPAIDDGPTREVVGVLQQPQVFDPKPRRYIKDVQWRLYKLKYYSGPIDGVDSKATQNALRGFFSVHTEAADATEERAIFSAIDKIYEQRH